MIVKGLISCKCPGPPKSCRRPCIVVLVSIYFHFCDVFHDVNIFVGFGHGKHFRHYSINKICHDLGKEISISLPFFHAFTGCDTTSQFLGKGKRSAWESWKSYPDVTEVFLFAFNNPFQLLQLQSFQMKLLERYVCVLYDKTTPLCSVNELRKELFCKKPRQWKVPLLLRYMSIHKLAMYGIWYLFVCSVLFYNM